MDTPALPQEEMAGAGAQAPPTAFGDDAQQDDGQTGGAGADTSYAGIHGPALAALDDKLKATAKANVSLKEQQLAITKQREILGKQTQVDQAAVQLAAQRHALAVTNTPQGALRMSSGAPNTAIMPQGALPLPGSAGAGQATWQDQLKGFDIDQHLNDANYSDEDHAKASAELKANTGKSAAEMYDELENRGLVLPSDAKLTDRQKGEMFLRFGLGMLKAHQGAAVVRPDQWRAPNTAAAMGAGGEAALGSYEQILQGQRAGALQQFQERQKIGEAAAGKQADLERAMQGRAMTNEMWLGREASQEKRTGMQGDVRREVVGTQEAGKGERQAVGEAGRGTRLDETEAGKAKRQKDEDAAKAAREAAALKAKGEGEGSDKAKAKEQAELDKEQDDARKRAAKAITDDPMHTYHVVNGKRVQYSEDELTDQYVSKMPAHQRAAKATAPQPKAGEKTGEAPKTATGAKGEKYVLSPDGKTWVEQK